MRLACYHNRSRILNIRQLSWWRKTINNFISKQNQFIFYQYDFTLKSVPRVRKKQSVFFLGQVMTQDCIYLESFVFHSQTNKQFTVRNDGIIDENGQPFDQIIIQIYRTKQKQYLHFTNFPFKQRLHICDVVHML